MEEGCTPCVSEKIGTLLRDDDRREEMNNEQSDAIAKDSKKEKD